MTTIQVKAAEQAALGPVINTLMHAFADDPAARWMYPNAEDYQNHFPDFIRAFGGGAFESGMVHETMDFEGVALWLPPGAHPDDNAIVELISRSVLQPIHGPLFALFDAMAGYHPREAHWHLTLLGVEPRRQGLGYGSALLDRALAKCDAERTLAYLESTNIKNIPLYLRHGFEVLGTIQVGTSPPITPMIRKPH